MITKEDAMAFVKQLEELKAEQQLKEDRGPLDLTRRIDELEAENKTLKTRLNNFVDSLDEDDLNVVKRLSNHLPFNTKNFKESLSQASVYPISQFHF